MSKIKVLYDTPVCLPLVFNYVPGPLANLEEIVKNGKRSLSDSDVDTGSKKFKLSLPDNLDCAKVAKKIISLNTLSEFMTKGCLKELSRKCLEEFCLQKMCEVVINKSEVGELRHQLQMQEEMAEMWRKEYTSLAKQMKDLDVVNKKLLNELKIRTEKPLVPVKITRSVGLQVRIPENNATSSTKKRSLRSSDTNQSISSTTNKIAIKSSPTPPIKTRQVLPKLTNSSLLSQALQKDTATLVQAARKSSETKGVIDLTDEDDKKNSTATAKTTSLNKVGNVSVVNKTQPVVRSTIPTTQSIHIVAPPLKPTIPAVVTNNGQRLMYVVSNPQMPQNIITNTTELTKPGAPKALMLKFQNGIIGQANGIIPAIQNGTSTISVLPQVTTVRNSQVRLQTASTTSPRPVVTKANRHPAPLPQPPPAPLGVTYRKPVPPKPHLSIRKSGQGIVLSWKMPYKLELYETIASYQLYAYQETTSPPSSDMWRKVGDVKALALPMACTLTQFADGNKYYFAVRAVDVYKRIGSFSEPEQIML